MCIRDSMCSSRRERRAPGDRLAARERAVEDGPLRPALAVDLAAGQAAEGGGAAAAPRGRALPWPRRQWRASARQLQRIAVDWLRPRFARRPCDGLQIAAATTAAAVAPRQLHKQLEARHCQPAHLLLDLMQKRSDSARRPGAPPRACSGRSAGGAAPAVRSKQAVHPQQLLHALA
eukprot:301722-Chlamydomonas_euryale.AAC.1